MANSLYLSRNNPTVVSNKNLVFDNVLFNEGNITYNTFTGVITLNESGLYNFNWWTATQSSSAGNASLVLTASSGETFIGNSPDKTGIITGLGVINVTAPPVTVSIKNQNPGSVYLSTTVPVKAMISVNMTVAVPSSETMTDFMYQQFGHILGQLITLYPISYMRAYTPGLYMIDGTPVSLYTSPEGNSPGIFVMLDGTDLESMPLNTILALKVGDGSVYNESITYLVPPVPLPQGWDTNIITAVHDYLPVGTALDLFWGVGNNKTGFVYKNEYGMLVITDDMAGNNPFFVLPTSSLIIIQ